MSATPPYFVMTTTLEGKVVERVHDGLGLGAFFPIGASLLLAVDKSNVPKLLDFLVALRRDGETFGWEFTLPDRSDVLMAAGVVRDGQARVMVARNQQDLRRLARAEGLTGVRAGGGNTAGNRESAGQEEDPLQALMRLNNEFANMQRQVAKQNARLDQLNQEKNRFLAMASHDLRKPLSVIIHYSGFVLDESAQALSDEHREFLRKIQAAGTFMKQMIDDFLDVAAIEAGAVPVRLQAVEAGNIIKGCLHILSLQAHKRQITLDVSISSGVPQVMADRSKMEQVLTNIIENAIQRTDDKGVVHIGIHAKTGRVVFSVRDFGPGMSENEAAAIFRPFASGGAKKKTGEKSSGLGLAIAKKLVTAMQGDIWVHSRLGQGSVFYIALPAAKQKTESLRKETDA